MSGLAAEEISRLMNRFREGDQQAAKQLVELLYPELRRLAGSRMRRERAGHTWQPTVLVNELFLELIKIRALKPQDGAEGDRDAFLKLAAHLMKRLLIHHSRREYFHAEKIPVEDGLALLQQGKGDEELTEIDSLLSRLEALAPRLRAVVELRVFEGLTGAEIAERLGCGPATVARDWSFAKRWLQEELQP